MCNLLPTCLQVMLRVTDLDRSIKFYTEALGMTLIRTRDNPDNKYKLAFLGNLLMYLPLSLPVPLLPPFSLSSCNLTVPPAQTSLPASCSQAVVLILSNLLLPALDSHSQLHVPSELTCRRWTSGLANQSLYNCFPAAASEGDYTCTPARLIRSCIVETLLTRCSLDETQPAVPDYAPDVEHSLNVWWQQHLCLCVL